MWGQDVVGLLVVLSMIILSTKGRLAAKDT